MLAHVHKRGKSVMLLGIQKGALCHDDRMYILAN